MNTIAPAKPLHTVALILAAGIGRRMGGRAKCLLEVQGQSLLERQMRSAHSLGLTPFLILGHHSTEILAHIALWNSQMVPQYVINPCPTDDPTSSLRVGLRALDEHTKNVLVLLADQPLIDAADIAAVICAFRERPAGCLLLVPMVKDAPGHPVIFDAEVRVDLLNTSGAGLREWRVENPTLTFEWATDNPHYVIDLDTPSDVESLARESGWHINWPVPQDGLHKRLATKTPAP